MILFRKQNENNKTILVINTETFGDMNFTFDGKKIYNFYKDYPQNLTKEELEIFNKEYPYLTNYKK